MFASASVPRHLLRGLVGVLALVGAAAGTASVGPVALLLLPVTVMAWRGCPTCWTVGLLQTMDRRRACRVAPPRRTGVASRSWSG